MKHIKLLISSKEKSNEITNVLSKHNIKIQNDFYLADDKKFKIIKDEINDLDIGVSISKNPDYVIIKEKMNKPTPPTQYVTQKQFDKFVGLVNNFISEQKEFNKEQKKFNKEQKEFNKEQKEFNNEQKEFNGEVRDYIKNHQ